MGLAHYIHGCYMALDRPNSVLWRPRLCHLSATSTSHPMWHLLTWQSPWNLWHEIRCHNFMTWTPKHHKLSLKTLIFWHFIFHQLGVTNDLWFIFQVSRPILDVKRWHISCSASRPTLSSLTMTSHGSCICKLKTWFPEAGWFSPFLDSVLMISRRVPFCFWNSQMPSYTKWRQRYCICQPSRICSY